jgi:hypothetical protein
MLMRSLKDRDYVTLVFNWQYYYYFLNAEGHAYLTGFLGLTDNVLPLTWIKDASKKYEHREQGSRPGKGTRPPGERGERGGDRDGARGGRGRRREGGEGETKQPEAPVATTTTPGAETTTPTPAS